MRMTTKALLMTLLLVGCERDRPTGACGQGFCLPRDAQLLSKQTPAEDFNLYQVMWRGTRFGIYEGNFPKGLNDPSGTVFELPVRRAGTLRVRGSRGSVIFGTQSKWPAYVDVTGPCQSPENCEVKALALELSLRS